MCVDERPPPWLSKGVNDSPEQAEALGRLLYTKRLASHVNLIPYNPVDDGEYDRPSRAAAGRQDNPTTTPKTTAVKPPSLVMFQFSFKPLTTQMILTAYSTCGVLIPRL